MIWRAIALAERGQRRRPGRYRRPSRVESAAAGSSAHCDASRNKRAVPRASRPSAASAFGRRFVGRRAGSPAPQRFSLCAAQAAFLLLERRIAYLKIQPRVGISASIKTSRTNSAPMIQAMSVARLARRVSRSERCCSSSSSSARCRMRSFFSSSRASRPATTALYAEIARQSADGDTGHVGELPLREIVFVLHGIEIRRDSSQYRRSLSNVDTSRTLF